MNEYEVLLEVFRNRGWLSARLISALLERSDADVGSYLAPLRSAGMLVQRSVRGGLVLYRLRPEAKRRRPFDGYMPRRDSWMN